MTAPTAASFHRAEPAGEAAIARASAPTPTRAASTDAVRLAVLLALVATETGWLIGADRGESRQAIGSDTGVPVLEARSRSTARPTHQIIQTMLSTLLAKGTSTMPAAPRTSPNQPTHFVNSFSARAAIPSDSAIAICRAT